MVHNLKNEEWIKIKNKSSSKYNFYVSNFGRIKINDRLSKIHINDEGYISVKVDKKRQRVHRLVYEHFGNDFNPNYHIHHKDGNKQNNHIDNLECISPAEHNRRHHSDNTFNRYKRGYILSDDEINAIASKYKPYRYTIPMLADEYNISESTVRRIIKKYKKS